MLFKASDCYCADKDSPYHVFVSSHQVVNFFFNTLHVKKFSFMPLSISVVCIHCILFHVSLIFLKPCVILI